MALGLLHRFKRARRLKIVEHEKLGEGGQGTVHRVMITRKGRKRGRIMAFKRYKTESEWTKRDYAKLRVLRRLGFPTVPVLAHINGKNRYGLLEKDLTENRKKIVFSFDRVATFSDPMKLDLIPPLMKQKLAQQIPRARESWKRLCAEEDTITHFVVGVARYVSNPLQLGNQTARIIHQFLALRISGFYGWEPFFIVVDPKTRKGKIVIVDVGEMRMPDQLIRMNEEELDSLSKRVRKKNASRLN